MGKITSIKQKLGAVIAVGNQKGGVGKSTNSTHLAAALGEAGYSVLLIDLDPTAGATKIFGVPTDLETGVFDLLIEESSLADVTLNSGEELTNEAGEVFHTINLPNNVSLVPASLDLIQLAGVLNEDRFREKNKILHAPIREAKKLYDFIFLDTPPNPADICTMAAYSIADWFLLSVKPAALDIAGLANSVGDIAAIRKRINPSLEVLGAVICGVTRTSNYWQQIDEIISNVFPGRGFTTMISQSVELSRAPELGITLFQDKKLAKHKCANEFRALAEEILDRAKNREKFISKSREKLEKKRANQ